MSRFLKQFIFIASIIAILTIGGLVIYSATPLGNLKINPILGHDLDLNRLYYGQAANNTVHDITTQDISISAWVKPDIGMGNAAIFNKNALSNGSYLFYQSGGTLYFYLKDGAGTLYSMYASSMTLNKWHHVVAILDRDNQLNSKLYIDGVDQTASRTGDITTIGSVTNTAITTLGAYSTLANKYGGQIRDVKLYYAAGDHWSDAQVLYQAQHPFDYSANAGTMTDYWRLDEGSGTTLYGKVNNLTLSNVLAWTTQPKIKMVKQENTTTTGNNPVGWWKMDEGTASSSFDSSGNGNTGTLTGGVQWATGKLGKGLSFDGVNDYVDSGYTGLNVNSNLTISYWLKTTDSNVGANGISPVGVYDGTGYIYAGRMNTSLNQISFILWDHITPIGVVYNNSKWRDGNWHLLTFLKSGNTQANLKIYIDGIDTNASAEFSGTIGSYVLTKNFFIGARNVNGTPLYFINALIDDVRIYNRALSAGEVGQMYNSTKDGYLGNIKVSTGLVGYWKLDDNNALTSVIDYSGKGNTGTAYSGTATTTSVLSTSTAMIGRAMGFDGVNDYISIADNANLRFGTGDFTVGFWVKVPFVGNDRWGGIIVKSTGDMTGAQAHSWAFLGNEYAGGENIIQFEMSTDAGGAYQVQLNTAYLSNGWHYILAKRSGIVAQLYVDGVYYSQSTNAISNLSTTANITINKNGNRYSSGLIDDVKIWNYARTAEQIKQDYERGLRGLP